LPQVASDPVVPRPLRPESPSGRAGAPAGEPPGAFEGLLDTPAAQRSRPERPARTRASDQPRPIGRRDEPAPESRPARESGQPAEKTSLKPTVTPHARQVSNARSPDAGEPSAKASETAAEGAPFAAAGFAAIAEAAAVETTGDASLVEQIPSTATVAPNPSEGSDHANIAVTADTAASPAPTAVIAAVAVPTLAAFPAADVSSTEAGIAPVDAPAMPADAGTPHALTPPAPSAETSEAASTKPQTARDAETAASAENAEAEKTAALKAVNPTEATDAKAPARADHKAESAKAKSGHPGIAHKPDAQHSEAAKSAADVPAEPQAKAAPHQQQRQATDSVSPTPRIAVAEARPELPVTAAPQAQIHAGGPMPFGLAVHAAIPLSALSPLVALRVDTAADNAVPVAGLAVEIVSRAQDGLRRFDIRLDPPELGRIDVRLDVDSAGKLTSRLTVERAETLDLLRRDAPQLERALQHAGLNTEGGLEFSLRDQNFANREQAPRNPAATQLIVPDDEAAAAEAARRGYGRMIGLGGGVDIRV